MTTRRINIDAWKSLGPVASYNAKKLASLCGVSVRQLERDFRSHTKKSPKDWLTEQRLESAKMGLMTGRSVKAIAFEAGFGSAAYFCRWFKVHVGLTPGSFQNIQRK
jgi:AraC family transcriptional regulator